MCKHNDRMCPRNQFTWGVRRLDVIASSNSVKQSVPSATFENVKIKNTPVLIEKKIYTWCDENGRKRQKTQTRGTPAVPLLERRIALFGPTLRALGVKFGEVSQSENIPGEENSRLKPWTERMSDILVGGKAEDVKKILHAFQHELASKKPTPSDIIASGTRYSYQSSNSPVILLEHLAKHPLAYGIEGMKGTMVRFSRGENAPKLEDELFYDLRLEPWEPSPIITPVTEDRPIDCLHVRNLGLYAMSRVDPVESDYDDYVVVGNTIHPVSHLFLASELEPSIMAPNPKECRELQTQISTRPDLIIPAKLCMYRSSMEYANRVKSIISPGLLQTDLLVVLEAYGIVHRMMKYAQEADIAMRELPLVNVTLMKALRYVFNILEQTPWYRTFCYWWLFCDVAGGQNPFELGTVRMRVIGVGDSSNSGYLSSYLPKRLFGEAPVKLNANDDWGGFDDQANDESIISPEQRKEQEIRALKRKNASNPPKLLKNRPQTENSADKPESKKTKKKSEPEVRPQDEGEDVSRFNGVSAKRKRSRVAAHGRTKIYGTNRDARKIPEAQLDDWITRLGLDPKEIEERWDKVWFLQTIASAEEIGRFILNGEIWSLRRKDKRAQQSSRQAGKNELINSKITIEHNPFFKRFREQTSLVWMKFCSLTKRPKVTIEPNTRVVNKQISDEELDEFANILEGVLMKKEEEDEGIVRFDKNKNFNVYVERLNEELNLRRQHQAWHAERAKERAKESLDFLVRRRITLQYLDRGRVTLDELNVTSTYYLHRKHRVPIAIPEEEPEIEIVIEE